MSSINDASVATASVNWAHVDRDLDAQGWAQTEPLFTPEWCNAMAVRYEDDALFRARIVMARHGFGRGEYRYFAYPLPDVIADLRGIFYAGLVDTANRWRAAIGVADPYPPTHAEYLARCKAAGQTRPTPLLLRYGPGDYNCLHQDLYGDHVFPLQAVVQLSRPRQDFEGGEFVLTEQRPRMQSRAQVIPLSQGEAVVFAVNQRPVPGSRGTYRVTMRHGVSEVRTGRRHTLGLILHDAA